MKYPILEIDLAKLTHNVNEIVSKCKNYGIDVAGVIKGANGIKEVCDCFINGGVKTIASSRIEQLKNITGIETMMIRIPLLSEIEDIIKYCNISLNSELKTINALNEESKKQNKIHKIILMVDLGDLREGFINEDELINVALHVENLDNVYLYGIGVNLGCYGSIKPTTTNLSKLVSMARNIEKIINRKLDIISGGATSSLTLVLNDTIPEGINHLRIGEGILLNRDLPDFWNADINFLNDDAFILKTQVIEKKDKPSYPIGEIFIDAFGNKPTYEDIGIRTRILLGIGKQDIGDYDKLIPLNDNIKLIGSSSDHLIGDITEIKDSINVGDVLSFKLCYQSLLFLTESPYITKVFK